MNTSENSPIKLSIVIAAWNGGDYLQQCLESLEKQVDEETEVIVAGNSQNGIDENKRLFSFAKFILLPDATVPELRTGGIPAASGAIIALPEDHCTIDQLWCQEIKKAHELPFGIIGGTVENACANQALNWAVYFYDYGNFMQPIRAGTSETLSGMNVSYKRETLAEVRDIYELGFFETFVNEELKNRNHELYIAPLAVVYHKKNYNFKTVVGQFYHQARSFAAKRVINLPFAQRALFIIVSLLLPILLPMRVILRTIKKKRHLMDLIYALPYLIILLAVWSAGEFCGYLFGVGASADKWR